MSEDLDFASLRRWICPHSRVSPEDGEGYAICLDCGGTVAVRLTKEIFDKQMEAMVAPKGPGDTIKWCECCQRMTKAYRGENNEWPCCSGCWHEYSFWTPENLEEYSDLVERYRDGA